MNDAPIYQLKRIEYHDNGTIGILYDPNQKRICYTCERPWLDNKPTVSCIPAGTYQVIPHNSPAHHGVWEVFNVPGRCAILIHNGNTENDSEGCIIVGDSLGVIDGLPAVLNSRACLNALQKELPYVFTLEIIS